MRRTTITVVTLALIAAIASGTLVGRMAGGSRESSVRLRIPAQQGLGSPVAASPGAGTPASPPPATPATGTPNASPVARLAASAATRVSGESTAPAAASGTPARQTPDPPTRPFATPARDGTPTVLAWLVTRSPGTPAAAAATATAPVRAASTVGTLEPAPAASPSPAATRTPTRTATSVPTATVTSTPRATLSPSATPTVSPSPAATATPRPPSPTPTATPRPPSPTPTARPTASPRPTTTPAATPSPSPAITPTPTATPATEPATSTPAPTATVGAGTQGWVVLEAEAAQIVIAQGNHTWEQRTDLPGYSGSGYMVAVPDDGTVVDQEVTARSPELRFLIAFPQPGTYYVWIRGWASNGGSDSVWIGLDGEASAQLRRVEGFVAGTWSWSGHSSEYPVALTIPQPGMYAVHLWMREDGFALDQIVLSREPALPATPQAQLGGALLPAGVGGMATAAPVITGDGTGGPAPEPGQSSER